LGVRGGRDNRATQMSQPDRDRAEPEVSDFPWLAPGAVRRDCDPDRGPLLFILGAASFFMGLVSFCVLVPVLIATPLGFAVWLASRRDLARMRTGQMGPRGKRLTAFGRDLARYGLLFSLVVVVTLACLEVIPLLLAAWK